MSPCYILRYNRWRYAPFKLLQPARRRRRGRRRSGRRVKVLEKCRNDVSAAFVLYLVHISNYYTSITLQLTAAVEEIIVESEIKGEEGENDQKRQFMEDVFKPRLESHRADVQQPHHIKEEEEDPQPPCLKEEEAECWTTREGECLLGQEEADLSKFPLNAVSVKTEEHEDKPPESSQLHHSPIVRHLPSEPQGWGSRVEEEQPQPPRIKGEDEDRSISQDADRFEGLEEFPVIVVIVKSEGNEVKGESEEKREAELTSSSSTQHTTKVAGGSQADKLLAPLSESDDSSHFTDTDDEDSKDKTCHIDKRHFKCSHCDNTFVTETNLNKHMRYHAEKTLECSVCSKRFLWKSHLMAHARIHSGEKPFSCSVCGKGFVASHCLQTHMRTHTGDKPFMCSVCGKTFSQTAHLNVHLRKHTMEKPFPCSICGKGFVRREYLKIHMRIHTGEKPFTCSVCGMDFIRDSYLKKHMTSHTGEKPFLCSVCGKRFSDKVRLTAHAKIHTVEKPFSCSICGIGFVQNQYLKVHMRLHTGDKPYTCSVCGVSYTRSQYLKRHMRKHTGEKVYRCSVCDERFFYQYQLNKHTCAGEKTTAAANEAAGF